MQPSLAACLAEAGLVGVGWVNVLHWAAADVEVSGSAPAAVVTLTIAVGGIILQCTKMFLDFRSRHQAFELEQARHDLAEQLKLRVDIERELKRRDEEVSRTREELMALQTILYGKPQSHDGARPLGSDVGQPNAVDRDGLRPGGEARLPGLPQTEPGQGTAAGPEPNVPPLPDKHVGP